MPTPNIVPRAANEGNLGTPAKPWLGVHAKTVTAEKVLVNGQDAATRSEALAREIAANCLHFDGVTAGAQAQWRLNVAEWIGGHTVSIGLEFKSTDLYRTVLGWGRDGYSTFAPFAAYLQISSGVNRLRLRLFGAELGHYVQWESTEVMPSYTPIRLAVRFPRGGVPEVFKDSLLLSGSFTSSGTPPSWNALPGNYFIVGGLGGGNPNSGRMTPPVLFNYAKTATEIAELATRGMTLADRQNGGASRVAMWALREERGLIANATATGFEGNTNSENTPGWVSSAPFSIVAGRTYTAEFTATKTGGEHGFDQLVVRLNHETTLSGAYSENSSIVGGKNRLNIVANTTASNAVFIFLSNSLRDLQFTISECRDNFGAVIQPEVTQTAQPRDKGPNQLAGLITPGVTPLGGRMRSIVGKQSVTGFVLGDQGIVFGSHRIAEVWVRPTTATIPTGTLRRTDGSGTTIVTAESFGTQGEWKKLTLTQAARNGKAGDKYHWTITSSADFEYEIIPTEA